MQAPSEAFSRRSFGRLCFRRLAAIATIWLLAGAPSWAANNGKADLRKIVAVGDSLSAGFQNFSLFDATTALFPGGQQYGFAAVVAHQAGHDLTLPLFTFPGVPANLLNPGLAPLYGRNNPGVQATNLSVPGFTVGNALANPFPGDPMSPIDVMSALILGIPQVPNTVPGCGPIPIGNSQYVVSELACAVALKPTTILASIGANDALQALTQGIQPTDPRIFAARYAALLGGLSTTGASVVVTNIPDVTTVPYLMPVPYYAIACPGALLPAGASDADFIVANLAWTPESPVPFAEILNPCINPAVRTAAMVQQAQNAAQAYNTTIARVANSTGAVVVDLASLYAGLRLTGYQLKNGKTLTTAFGGGLFSLDGIHPTNTGYAIMANETIQTMNRQLKTHIPLVDVDAVAAVDPLVPRP